MSDQSKKDKKAALLARWRKKKAATAGASEIPTRPTGQVPLAASGQQRLWFLQQQFPNSPFYQYGHLYHIQGALNTEQLQQSLNFLVARHEILRTNFIETEAGLTLKIHPQRSVSITATDLTALSKEEQQVAAKKEQKQITLQPFDLATDPLIRIHLLIFSKTNFQIILGIHHIIGDRLALNLLNQEWFSHYEQSLSGAAVGAFPKLTIQYADYAHWQNQQTTNTKNLAYWSQKLEGELPVLNLPTTASRPQTISYEGATQFLKLSSVLTAKLRELAKAHQTTLYVVTLAAFKTLLYRITQEQDLLVGTPINNRDKVELENLIGFFNETIVLRTHLKEEWTFGQLIENVKQTTAEAFEHKDLAFETLVKKLAPERQRGIHPIFQVMFLYNNESPDLGEKPALDIREEMLDLGTSKFDLTLFVSDHKDYLELSLEYVAVLFGVSQIQRLLSYTENILIAATDKPQSSLSEIAVLPETEYQLLIKTWNDNKVALPPFTTIHEVIEKQVAEYRDHTAVNFEKDTLTYQELNDQAEAVAHNLHKAGLRGNHPVGLYMDRSVEAMVGLLGILKAGGFYLPLDPDYPTERIQYMLEDSGTDYVVTRKLLADQLKSNLSNTDKAKEQKKVIIIEAAVAAYEEKSFTPPTISGTDYAYLIYTSGSTGKPKGVPIQHENILHSTLARRSFYPVNPTAFLLLSSFSFDSSVAGIFWTLTSGGKLVLPRKRIEQDISALTQLIREEEVTHTLMLPTLYQAILNHADSNQLASLQNIMVAGEACPFALIDQHYKTLPTAILYNEYGPTEATVWCIAHEIKADEKDFVPIGKPIPNTEIYLLDKKMQPVPIGVRGALYVGGPGVATGYWQRPEQTAQRFLPHPFNENIDAKIYQTGDVARYHEDGRIEFLGRADQQVKLRGFRVEPDEIRKVMAGYPEVENALVIVAEAPRRLVGYFTFNKEIKLGEIRNYLQEKLPEYMVPAVLLPIAEFPKLPNGKINRKALPDPVSVPTENDSEYIAPVTELEKQLVAIWQEVLSVPKVGTTDNFFSIGGDSILSIQILAKAKKTGIALSPTLIFSHQTIAELAEVIAETKRTGEIIEAKIPDTPSEFPLSYLQKAFITSQQISEKDPGQLALVFDLSGDIDFSLFQKAWEYTTARHAALRTRLDAMNTLQIVGEETALNWTFLNWAEANEKDFKERLDKLHQSEMDTPISLMMAPTSRLFLIKKAGTEHVLFWSCHHLFLDGWSCGIILKDALKYYDDLKQGRKSDLPAIAGFTGYLQWEEEQNQEVMEGFWKKELAGFQSPLIFKNLNNQSSAAATFADDFLKVDRATSDQINAWCQHNRITLSTWCQGMWTILLSKYFDQKDVLYGMTVSGRFVDFPRIELMSGLMMNVIPNRIKVDHLLTVNQWLEIIQKEQGKKGAFENIHQNQLRELLDWPTHLPLFESLFVFGNFLKDSLQIGDVTVTDFSGGFSSSYPLTMRVNPVSAIEINWRYDTSKLNKKTINWFKKQFLKITQSFTNPTANKSMDALVAGIETPKRATVSAPKNTHQTEEYIAPSTPTELALASIWEKLFDETGISVKADFFEFGGKSLMAIELFARIEKRLNKILPPVTLLSARTISDLAKLIDGEHGNAVKFDSLVPLRSTGSRPPLFCLHGGGGHVFFYRDLARHLPAKQPIYTLQPQGLDGQGTIQKSIKEMAAHYIKEITALQAKGPYYILGTCFSNAVALEMANQLTAVGKTIGALFIIDSGPVHLIGDGNGTGNPRLGRFMDMIKKRDFSTIQRKLKGKLFGENKKMLPPKDETDSERQLRITVTALNKMYADYHWTPYAGKINFIRSTEFASRADKDYHLTQWNKLAAGGLSVSIVEGHHITLFEEPEVAGLAEVLASKLVNAEKEAV